MLYFLANYFLIAPSSYSLTTLRLKVGVNVRRVQVKILLASIFCVVSNIVIISTPFIVNCHSL